jgi:hypothetical protein
MTQEELEKKVEDLEKEIASFKGANEILFVYIYVRLGKNDFYTFLQSVSDSGGFTQEAKVVAKRLLDLDSVFGEQHYTPGQVQQ